ncbi:related to hsp70 protein [Cephalotrichum gorgonifer]|uniref:Related to hsp70 protein n=1 Tax=Cephalotrichum gorgonifer TaxID=2041049 RepID=A0AAE8N4G0_9PEZI|nr:related to hsp70 protein [Cephalotrichum gorgonifer]
MNRSRSPTLALSPVGHFTDRLSVAADNGNRTLESTPRYERDSAPDHGRIIIAVDFGTTYSAVSYVKLEAGESIDDVSLDRVRSIADFPDDWNTGISGDRMQSEVPTEVMYPLDRHFRDKEWSDHQWRPREHDVADGAMSHADPDAFEYDIFGSTAPDDDDDDTMEGVVFTDEPASYRWGYGVHEVRTRLATYSNPQNRPLYRFKLLLDTSPMTAGIRDDLRETLDELRRTKIIKHDHDVIEDFLTSLLRHTKAQLEEEITYDETYRTEVVISVPTIWTQRACRVMQTAMGKAIQRAAFKGVDVQNSSIKNLFIVSEPEAAAAYVLATDQYIQHGDTFVLLDAGGGTVDANTYTVTSTSPLSLVREVDTPGGGLFGSSYVNQEFSDMLRELLATETYLDDENNGTIRGHVERIIVNEFEYRMKRSFDMYKAKGNKSFDIPGLRDNPVKGFKNGSIKVHVDKIKKAFQGCLEGIAGIMEEQIEAARAEGVSVDSVILIGGFGASPSLYGYLKERLERYCRRHGSHIKLKKPKDTATAVASGAVLRAINKGRGPRRTARSSYGILRTEPHGEFPEHEGVKPTLDKHDGLAYVTNTIDWVLKLGQEVDPVWASLPFECTHTFDCRPGTKLICREVLYVSDSSTESHYRLKHPKNADAEKVGEIIVDFTFLRDEGRIFPIQGALSDTGKQLGKRHYRVDYDLIIEVENRDLRCKAVYDGQEMEKCRINIASAFNQDVERRW